MLKRLMSVLFVMLLCGGTALAQSTYGTLLGTVKDSSGGVVPNASVVVTEQNTNVSRSGATDSVGDYQLPNLLPGTYRVSVRAPGFKEFLKTDVVLDSRAIVRVDGTLAPGATQTSVEVKAAAPVITTETGTVSHVETTSVIEQLPTNYRALDTSPLSMVYTIPGVNIGNNGISMGGDLNTQNFYSVDGFSSVSTRENGPEPEQFPSTDGVAEMKVITEVPAAEYRSLGNVDFTTKGGTNQFHGTLFEYLQNSAVNAIPDFSVGKPPFRANDFGGSIGGPVILPHYNGKDRTFFFASYEGNRQSGLVGIVDNVPTQAMRQGDFSALCSSYSAAGVCASTGGTQLVNPFTGSPFPNNQIPSGMITSVSTNVLNTFYPLPNAPNANPLNTASNSVENGTTLASTDMFGLRIDQNVSSKQSIFARFNYKNIPSETPLGLLQGDADSPTHLRSMGVSYTYAIRPQLLDELRASYQYFWNPITYPKFPNGPQVVAQLGLTGLGPLPNISAYPYFEFDGTSGVSPNAQSEQQTLWYNNYSVSDDLTWIHGRHTLKMGFVLDGHHFTQNITDAVPDFFGENYFNGEFTGYDFADFLLGLPNNAITGDVPTIPGKWFKHDYAAYVQDSFQVSSKLTFNFGLRYEYHPPMHETTGAADNIDLADNAAVIVENEQALKTTTLGFEESVNSCLLPTPNPTPYGLFPCTPTATATTLGIPSTLRFSDKTMFLPRASFAYRLNPKTVIRAGAGMYDEALVGTIGWSTSGNHDAVFVEFPNAITNGKANYEWPVATGATTAGISAGSGVFGTAVSTHLRDPYASQWAFTVERDLGHNMGLQINYTGTRSVGLLVSPDMNQIAPQDTPFNPTEQPYPNWSDVKDRVNGASQSYNALELVVTHRFGGGLFFQSSWVYAKDLSDAQGDNPSGFTPNGEVDNGQRVMNRFDLHADYGNVVGVPTHRWLTTFVYDLPLGRGRKFGAGMNAVLDKVIGGWQTSNILIFQTGSFLTPYYPGGADPSGTDPSNRQGAQRPDRLPASACSGLTISQGQLLDGSCFYYGWPGQIGRFGNSGLGILTGPGTAIWNLGLSKFFPLNERTKLQFQASATNLPNHPNFGAPATAANSPSFGVISSLQNMEGAGARVFQFALRLTF